MPVLQLQTMQMPVLYLLTNQRPVFSLLTNQGTGDQAQEWLTIIHIEKPLNIPFTVRQSMRWSMHVPLAEVGKQLLADAACNPAHHWVDLAV